MGLTMTDATSASMNAPPSLRPYPPPALHSFLIQRCQTFHAFYKPLFQAWKKPFRPRKHASIPAVRRHQDKKHNASKKHVHTEKSWIRPKTKTTGSGINDAAGNENMQHGGIQTAARC
jgi:hypothetical protein